QGHGMFPVISDKGVLYRASKGHLGRGGLDVYPTTESGHIDTARVPVKSNADHLASRSKEETGLGYVAPNRSGGKGGDDVYQLKRLEPCNVNLIATVVDNETNNPLEGVAVTIKDASGQVVSSQTTNMDGQVTYLVSCEESLEISGDLKGYVSNSISYSGSKEKEALIQLHFSPVEKIIQADRVVLNPILFDFDKANITAQGAFELDKLVTVMQKRSEERRVGKECRSRW